MEPASVIAPSAKLLAKIYRLVASKEQLALSATGEDSKVHQLLRRPDAVSVVIDATVSVLRVDLAHEFPSHSWEPAKANAESLLRKVEGRSDLIKMVGDPPQVVENLMADGGGNEMRLSLGAPDDAMFDRVLSYSVTALCTLLVDRAEWFVPEGIAALLRIAHDLRNGQQRLELTLTTDTAAQEDALLWSSYTTAYLERVQRRSSKVEIVGIDLVQVSEPYSLADSFHHLKISQRDHEFRLATTNDLVEPGRCVLLVGEPGSGKSTILRWLAASLAADHVATNAPVPFLIQLKRLDTLPAIDTIADAFTDGLPQRRPSRWPQDLVESGTAVLLLDGLDETSPGMRKRVIEWSEELLERSGRRGLSIVLTSRPHAAQAIDENDDSLFVRFEVQPMSRGDIDQFIDLWWRSTASQRRSEKFVSREELKRRITGNPVLVDLARNPLLAAVLCSLYCVRARSVAADRADLYQDVTHMLLRKRDVDSDIPTFLSYRQARSIAQKLAMAFVDDYATTRPLTEVYDLGRKVRSVVPALHEIGHKRLVDEVMHRSYLIRTLPPDDDVDFWHNSFKEYLAACEIRDEHRQGDLMVPHQPSGAQEAGGREDDAWTEVRHWACAVMGTQPASDVVNWLIDQSETAGNGTLWRREALICGDYATSLDEPTSRRLDRLVDAMLLGAQERADLQTWRRVGESGLRLLTRAIAGNRGNAKQAAAARIAAAIGGEEAIQSLAELPDSVKADIAYDLLGLWRRSPEPEITSLLLGFPSPGAPTHAILRTAEELLVADGIGSAFEPHVAIASSEDVHKLSNLDPIDLKPTNVWTRGITLVDLMDLLRYVGGAVHVESRDLTAAAKAVDIVGLPTSATTTLALAAVDGTDLDLANLQGFADLETIELTGFRKLNGDGATLPSVRHATVLARSIDPRCLPQSLLTLTIDWPEPDFLNAPGIEELTDLRLGADSALTSLEGIERFHRLAWLDLSAVPDAVRLDLSPLNGCGDLEEVVMPAWADLSAVILPEGLAATIAADGEMFGLPADHQALLPELVPQRWYEDAYGVSDDELDLRGWNDYIWPSDLMDDLTSQDRKLDAHMAGERAPAIEGDDATVGWNVDDGLHLRRYELARLRPGSGRPQKIWPTRRALEDLSELLSDFADHHLATGGDEVAHAQLTGAIARSLNLLDADGSGAEVGVEELADGINELDASTYNEVLATATELDPRWVARL